MKIVVLNSVSLQLFELAALIGKEADEMPGIKILKVQDHSPIQKGDEVVSFIGHPDTAAVAGVPVNTNKSMYKPELGSEFWVYQLICPDGKRLPNGATTLPKDFKCLWVLVKVS